MSSLSPFEGEVTPQAQRWLRATLLSSLAALVLLGAVLVGARFGVLLPQGRFLIEAAASGLKVGRLGRLKVVGVSGDIWRDLSVQKLTLQDEKGVWLEADNIHMTWRYLDLLRRHFHVDLIEAQSIKVLRRPSLTAGGEDSDLPLSVHVGQAKARIEIAAGLSYERGVYDLDLNLDVERNGDKRGQVRGVSVLRPGDHLYLDYDLARRRPIMFLADVVEAKGGALAGISGLPATQPFSLQMAAGGKLSDGKFAAVASSGANEPLRVSGDWNEQGGEAHGRIRLTTSSLTASQAGRLGPEASFILVARKARLNLYAVEVRLSAENLAFRAHGFVDRKDARIDPRGLDLVASTQNLSRLLDAPVGHAAQVSGRLTGNRTDWRFSGAAQAAEAEIGGYTLAKAAGPVDVALHGGQWDVKAQMAGSGGSGSGFLAAMLGLSPKANFDGSRLADGRLLLRDLQVSGPGLSLQATGVRGLVGDLALKGKATATNLAAARVGAAGAVQASWLATQGRAGQPWNLAIDARGEGLATGERELDRLVGTKPGLTARASLQGRRLKVNSAEFTGAAMGVSGAGELAEDGMLSAKLDWRAEGPFRLGPIEISGKAKGTGAVNGGWRMPRLDLIANIPAVDLPGLTLTDARVNLGVQRTANGADGTVAVGATGGGGPARGRTDFQIQSGGIALTDLAVDVGGARANGAVSFRGGELSATDLAFSVTRGAYIESGRVNGALKVIGSADAARVTLSLVADNVRPTGSGLTLTSAKVSAEGGLSRLSYVGQAAGVSENGRWSLNGRGALTSAHPGYGVSFDGRGQLGGRDLHTVETAQIRLGGVEQGARLRLAASDGGRIDLDGALTEAGADVKVRLANFGLGLLDDDLAGKVDATLMLQGKGSRLDGVLDAKLVGARGRGAPASSGIDGTLGGRLSGDGLAIELAAANGQGLKADTHLVLPVEASAAPFRVAIARERPMRGQFQAQGEVRPLFDLLVGGERSLAGQVRTSGTIAGTLAKPLATGAIAVEAGRFDDGVTGLSLRDVALSATFDQSGVNVAQAAGVDGHGGTATGAGRISLTPEGTSSLRLTLKAFRLVDNDLATASASGPATISRGPDGRVKLAGNLTIDRADVAARLPTPSGVVAMEVVEKNRPIDLPISMPPANVSDQGWALDVNLKADRGVFLKGRGLDTELSLDAHVGGTSGAPNLTGKATVVRGAYDFAGKRFEFDPTSVVYLSTHAESVRLDLTATRDDPSLTAQVRIRGTAARPQITLSSTPSLPNDEVLSQVLFGHSASQLSPLEAAQLASALASLRGGGGLDVVGNLRALARLDRLVLGGGAATGVTVSGGKYVTRNVYLELTGGGREGPSAQVEWRVKRNLSIVSRLGGIDAGRLAIRWRRDY